MLLILAERTDALAAGLAARADRCGRRWAWLTPVEVGLARVTHALEPAPRTVLRAGRSRIDTADVGAVLNRLRWLPAPAAGSESDFEYSAAERHALMISVLAAVPGVVVNPVVPPSLSAPDRSCASWLALAAACGAPVRAMLAATDGRRWPDGGAPLEWRGVMEPGRALAEHPAGLPVGRRPIVRAEPVAPAGAAFVVGGEVFAAAAGLVAPLLAMARTARVLLLRVELGTRRDGSTVVIGADPFPDHLPPDALAALDRLVAP